MKPSIVIAIIVSILIAGWLLLPVPQASSEGPDDGSAAPLPADSFVLRAGRVFTGTALLEPGMIEVRDGVIVKVGAEIPVDPELPQVDLGERTLLPGLIDAHVHVFGTGAEDALNFGVTTMLDQANDAGQITRLQEAAEGARIYSSGPPATAPGGHGTQFGFTPPPVQGPDDAAGFVEQILASGSDWMKIIIERGGANWQVHSLDRATVDALIKAAQAKHVLTVAHASEQETARWAIEAGADGLAHVFADQAVGEALLEQMVKKGSFVIPTLVVLESVAGLAEPARADDDQVAPWLSAGQRVSLAQAFPGGRRKETLRNAIDNTRAMHAAGIDILAGSDAPNPGTAHGLSLHHELQLLVEAGLSPAEALAAATVLPARHFRLNDLGGIAPGKRADLLVVDGNPVENIADTLAIYAIWQAGRPVSRVERRIEPGHTVPSHGRLSAFTPEQPESGFGVGWVTTDDRMSGGNSEVGMESGGDERLAYIRLTGEIRSGFPWPWAGTMMFPGPQAMVPVDLSAFSRLHFRARGDIPALRVLVFSPGMGPAPATQTVEIGEQWTELHVDLAEFAGTDPREIQGIAFVAGPGAGSFQFDLAQVRLE